MKWLDPPFNMIVTGRTGCGKTHYILDLLSTVYRYKFNYIVIFCPTIYENTTYNRPFLDLDEGVAILPPDEVYQDLNKWLSVCGKIYGDPKCQTLFLIDDCANLKASKTKSSELTKLAFSGRHQNISVWVLTQKYNAVVKDFRDNIKMLVMHYEKDDEALKDALRENKIIPVQDRDYVIKQLDQGNRLVMRLLLPTEYELV